MTSSTQLARLVVDELVRHGVRDAVLAPGSRSAPLALALHAADSAGRLRLHVRVDERTAGFLALGLARGARAPVPVITTSGSAVAHLHPAVLEAHHSGVPVLVMSADRPAALRDTGANQTTDQSRLFGAAVRHQADVPAGDGAAPEAWRALVSRAVAAATGALTGDPGPVHLNLCFAEPLLPARDATDDPPPGRPDGAPWTRVPQRPAPAPVTLEPGPRTVVVAGADSESPARVLAEQADWPLLAEPASGARTGTHPLRSHRLLLGHAPLVDQVQRVVVFGRPTLSRPVTRLLSSPAVEVVVCADRMPWPDPGHRAAAVHPAVRSAPADPGWRALWSRLDAAVSESVDAVLDEARAALAPGTLLAHDVARAVAAALPDRGLLVVGSSHPVRDLDLVAPSPAVGGRRLVLANRGLSGIDGTLSTAVGAALARPSSRALAYVGDLTFLHDLNGLLLGPAEPRPDLTVVVADDDGGSIFSVLEQGAPEHAAAFERVFGTPTGADLAAACAVSGTPHRLVGDREALAAALATPAGGIEVVQAVVDRAGRRALDQRLSEAAHAVLADLLP